jgi:hypothetical protein
MRSNISVNPDRCKQASLRAACPGRLLQPLGIEMKRPILLIAAGVLILIGSLLYYDASAASGNADQLCASAPAGLHISEIKAFLARQAPGTIRSTTFHNLQRFDIAVSGPITLNWTCSLEFSDERLASTKVSWRGQ